MTSATAMAARHFARRRWCRCLAAVLSLALSAQGATAAARPVRVCLPPAPYSSESGQRLAAGERLRRCVSLWFRERLTHLPGVEVMNEEWAAAVHVACGPDVRGADTPPTLAEVQAVAPLDVVLLFGDAEASFSCVILSDAGARGVPAPAQADTTGWLAAVAAALAPALGLDAAGGAALADFGAAPAAMVEACLLSQRIATGWVINSGETQLVSLRPFIREVDRHPLLAAALLRAGVVLSTDRRTPENVAQCVEMLRLALVAALGTPAEEDAVAFMRATVHGRDSLEQELVDLVRPLTVDEADALLAGVDDAADDGLVKTAETRPDGPAERARRIGAIRCLAAMGSAKLAPLLPRLAEHDSPDVRAAAGFALATTEAGPAASLDTLAADADPRVAFAGGYARWRRGGAAEPALAAARARLDAADGTPQVREVLSQAGAAEDEPRLRRLLAQGSMGERRTAIDGLARLGLLSAADFRASFASADDGLVARGLQAMTPNDAAACRDALVALANQPHAAVAEAARRALRPLRPPDLQAALAHDLEVEHLYLRLRALERLAQAPEPWATALLEQAAANRDPQVRAQALLALHGKAPAAALGLLPRLLTDPAVWVRVHASSLAAALRAPALQDAVAAALAGEQDPACRIHLETAQGKPPPKPANPFAPAGASFGLCGHSTHAAASPFGWYYNLSLEVKEPGRQAHAAGKCLMGRANSVASNPGQVLFHPLWRDRWWTNLRREAAANLPWLDGVVLGEETMYAPAWGLWPDAWRCFCVEAGLDPDTIAGDRSKLTPAQARAYLDWEQERAVDGFNRMYEFIKLDLGARRPGFLVGTFMPDQNGASIAERRWKFDVGGAYWYETNNRVRYNMVRRHRTAWPGRPLMYLVSGNAGLPLLAPVNYKLAVPTDLILNRACNAYADAVAAWAAGADPGYFVAWLFMGKDVKPGPMAHGKWVWLEDVAPHSAILDEGVATVWAGVAGQYRLEADMQAVKERGPGAAPDATAGAGGVDDELEETDLASDAFSQRADAERGRFRRGFFLEQKALYDIARALTGLPRPAEAFGALLVGDRRALPQFAALPGYDVVEWVHLLPRHTLERYRLIGIEANPDTPLRDETIAALSAWLREQPALLYIRGFLSTDNTNEASTATDHDGRLALDWPWEDAVAFRKDHYALTGAAATALAGEADACTRALWRGDGFKGAVLFDCAKTTAAELQALLNTMVRDHGVGLAADGVPGMIPAAGDGIAALASNYGADADVSLAGIDLYTGEPDPVVARGRSAALTAAEHRAPFAAAYNGVTILCDAPIADVKPIPGGLEVRCPGLVRASSAAGEVRIQVDGIPQRTGTPEEILDWILFGQDPGQARLAAGTGSALFVRGGDTPLRLAAPARAAAP